MLPVRTGLTMRLFLATLALAALLVLVMGVAAQWSFQRGFIDYLNQQAAQRMDVVLPRLEQAWREQRSWEFLRDRPKVWFELIGIGPPPDYPPQRRHAMPPLLASELLGAGRRLTLLDAQRRQVMGFPFLLRRSALRPIVVDGQTVGWLSMAPIDAVTDGGEHRFLASQLRISLWVGVLALALAALIAWHLARTLLAPVRALATATHRLAAGAYETRVTVPGQDELAQLACDFNQLALTLERNERMRRDYMADISHELRTPLAVLRGELEAMEDGVHPVTPDALRALQTEVATLAQLVGDLHELALADVGALSYRKTALDLGALLADELAVLRGRCEAAGLQLRSAEPAEEAPPLTVEADAARLRQLLHNLLANAVRYTDTGGTVQVTLQALPDTQPTMAELLIDDSPPGVAAEHLPRLFERFYRVEASRGRAGGGSGLGLAICQTIVQAHGGQIGAEPSPLGGLRVRVRLPLARGLAQGRAA